MHIPSTWVRATGKHPSLQGAPVTVWGWGEDASSARTEADGKLKRLLERLTRGEPFPDKYAYGGRPLREEILQVIAGADPAEPAAMLTRNAYGAQVLNTARVLFLDIDVPALSLGDKLKRLFGGKTRAQAMLERTREQLRAQGATFRLYETARGYRAMAIDREYDPVSTDTQKLMTATGTDPAFAQLCRAQKSFRARLTPKPWRCGIGKPPSEYPREGKDEQPFRDWLSQYEKAAQSFATCRFLEAVGAGSARGAARDLVALHDRLTRANEKLPLA